MLCCCAAQVAIDSGAAREQLVAERATLLRAHAELEWLQLAIQSVKRLANSIKHADRAGAAVRALRSGFVSAKNIVRGLVNVAVDLSRYFSLFNLLFTRLRQLSPEQSTREREREIEREYIIITSFDEHKAERKLLFHVTGCLAIHGGAFFPQRVRSALVLTVGKECALGVNGLGQ